MTEAMPFLRKLILLSYDPRPWQGVLLHIENCGKTPACAEHPCFADWGGGEGGLSPLDC